VNQPISPVVILSAAKDPCISLLQLFVSPAPTAGNVISTEDVHSFTVNRAVESPRISLSTQNKS
jgi:hypothetical protein